MSSWGISEVQIATIDAIVSIFESERPGDYGAIARDPNDAGGLSYGKHQAALTKGSLFNLISAYCKSPEAQCAAELSPYLPKMQAGDRTLDTDKTLYAVLKKAALDPSMQRVQDAFFSDSYMKPALTKWQELGFKTALAAGVIYDSYIHSGGLNMLNRTVAKYGQPSAAAEKEWIAGYVATRKDWLTQNYPATAVRMRTFEGLVQAGNWDLALPIRVVRNTGSYPLTAYDLGAFLFENAIRRLGQQGFGTARAGDASGPNGRDRFVQSSLAGLGYGIATVDGLYGKGTTSAVKSFQKDNGLQQTGEVDGRCFDKLCGQVEEKGSTGAGAAKPTDHGLVELPPEQRNRLAVNSKTGGGVAAGAAGAAGVVGAAAGSGGDQTASPDTSNAAATGVPVAASTAAAPAAGADAAATAGTTSAAGAAPATPALAPAPAAASVAAAPTTSGSTEVKFGDHKLNVFGLGVPESVIALTAVGFAVVAIALFAHGRRQSY